MKLKFASKYQTVGHIESQKQPSKQKYNLLFFFKEIILFKHVFERVNTKNRCFFKKLFFGCFQKVDETTEKIIIL